MTKFEFEKMIDGLQNTILEMYCVGNYGMARDLIERVEDLECFWDMDYGYEKWTMESLEEYEHIKSL